MRSRRTDSPGWRGYAAAVAELAAEGVGVAYLGSIAIPQEETCFCLFAAESPAVIEQVNSQLVVPSLRVVSALSSESVDQRRKGVYLASEDVQSPAGDG